MSFTVTTTRIDARAIGAAGEDAMRAGAGARALVARVTGEARIAGAFERARAGDVRRASGGATVTVGEGTVYLLLALPSLGALDPSCRTDVIVNRYARPLLRALGRAAGAPAHYFGRDWIAVARRPAAYVAFAHERATGRAVVEAFVAVTSPFAGDPERASFLGREPGTLASITGERGADTARVASVVAQAYAEAYGGVHTDAPFTASAREVAAALAVADDPPWDVVREEAIGPVGALVDHASGAVRVGGELLVSRDALGELEAAASAQRAASGPREWTSLVRAHLAAPGVALEGARLETIAELLAALA